MIDLLQYITSRYPESIRNIRVHKSGNWQSIRAVWRGDKIASCGIKWYGDRWRFNDYATGQHGDVVDFLVQVEGYDKAEALKIATGGAGFSKPAKVSAQKPEPVVEQPLVSVSERTRKFANQCVRDLRRDGVPAVWFKRGFSMADCVKLKLGRNGNDGVFPILRGKKLVNLKIRLANTERGKYRYAEPGHGSPAWYSPNLETADAIILLEGELNAMAVWLSMAEQYGVIGMAGASQPVTSSDLEVINGRPVYVMADDDQAGRDAALRWCSQVDSSIGILRPFGKQDACDIHAVYGKKILSGRILTRILELNKTRKSGRDGAVRSWLSPAESVRDRSISIARSTSAARLSPLPTPLSKGIEYICRAFPEVRTYAIRLGKNTAFCVFLALKNGQFSAKMLAEFANIGISRAHEIINELQQAGLLIFSKIGRTKVVSLVRNWRQAINAMMGIVKSKFESRLQQYLAAYRLHRDVFWQWVETTVQGWKWLGVHSGLVRLST